jgi:lipoyl(octanoyl) transferase
LRLGADGRVFARDEFVESMSILQPAIVRSQPAVEAYLLGLVDFDACLALQQRLVYESAGRTDGQISLLVCEHPLSITVGRQGSRAHIRLDKHELVSRGLDVRWVNRGGGCLVHAPGQLAIYPIVPLEPHGLSVGAYLQRLQSGILAALEEQRFSGRTEADRDGIWGRAGQVAFLGAAVKNGISYYGAYLNVAPATTLFRWVESDPVGHSPMSSLVIERQQPVRMSGVREALVRRLAEAFGCERYHLYTGHPLLNRHRGASHAPAARVG